MNILITGGTGTVGSWLVCKLSKSKKDRIFVLSRKEMKSKGNVFYIKSNLCSTLDLDLKGIDIVYHLAANIDEQDPEMYEQNIKMTKNVIELCFGFIYRHATYFTLW